MYKIEYLPAALRDLTEIALYISNVLQNKKAALDLTQEIVGKVDGLAGFPYKNAVYLPIRPLKYEYRHMAVKNYLIFCALSNLLWQYEMIPKISRASCSEIFQSTFGS